MALSTRMSFLLQSALVIFGLLAMIEAADNQSTTVSSPSAKPQRNLTRQEKFEIYKRQYITWMEKVVEMRWADKYSVAWWVGIIPSLAAIASIGNLLVLVVASMSRQFRTVSCIFLTNLAAIDVFQTVVIVPFRGLETFVIKFPFNQYWICKFVYTMREALYICYVETFVLIAIERYIVVVYPMKALQICTKRRARLSLLATWLLSLVFAFPTWFQMSLVGAEYDWPICARDIIRPNYPGVNVDLWRKLHESYSLFLLYVLPLGALIVCYTVIAVALHRSIEASHQLTQKITTKPKSNYSTCSGTSVGSTSQALSNRKMLPDLQRERVVVLRMCVVLVVLFGACQGPWRIDYWTKVIMPRLVSGGIREKLHAPFFALILLNSAVNPFIYGFMSRHFRQAFVMVIAKCCFIPIRVYRQSKRRHTDRQSRTRKASDGSKSTASSILKYCQKNRQGSDPVNKSISDQEGPMLSSNLQSLNKIIPDVIICQDDSQMGGPTDSSSSDQPPVAVDRKNGGRI